MSLQDADKYGGFMGRDTLLFGVLVLYQQLTGTLLPPFSE